MHRHLVDDARDRGQPAAHRPGHYRRGSHRDPCGTNLSSESVDVSVSWSACHIRGSALAGPGATIRRVPTDRLTTLARAHRLVSWRIVQTQVLVDTSLPEPVAICEVHRVWPKASVVVDHRHSGPASPSNSSHDHAGSPEPVRLAPNLGRHANRPPIAGVCLGRNYPGLSTSASPQCRGCTRQALPNSSTERPIFWHLSERFRPDATLFSARVKSANLVANPGYREKRAAPP